MLLRNLLTGVWLVGAVVVTEGCSAGTTVGSATGAMGGVMFNKVIDRAVVARIRDRVLGLLLWLFNGSEKQHLHVGDFLPGLIAFAFTDSLARKELPFKTGGINKGFVGIGIVDQ